MLQEASSSSAAPSIASRRRDLFVCELIEVPGILFAFVYPRALFGFEYGVELHGEAKLVRWNRGLRGGPWRGGANLFPGEVLLGDLFSLALFLGLAFAVGCAALDGGLLLLGAFVLVGIAGTSDEREGTCSTGGFTRWRRLRGGELDAGDRGRGRTILVRSHRRKCRARGCGSAPSW